MALRRSSPRRRAARIEMSVRAIGAHAALHRWETFRPVTRDSSLPAQSILPQTARSRLPESICRIRRSHAEAHPRAGIPEASRAPRSLTGDGLRVHVKDLAVCLGTWSLANCASFGSTLSPLEVVAGNDGKPFPYVSRHCTATGCRLIETNAGAKHRGWCHGANKRIRQGLECGVRKATR